MTTDKLSVILPVYNGAPTLERALCSILAQTQPLDELVVVDDGSTDQTGVIITDWRKKLPIVSVHNEKNMGLTRALQRGMNIASGSLIFRLDGDDAWLPHHVETLVGLRSRDPHAVLYASRATNRAARSGDCLGISAILKEGSVRAKLLWDNPIVHSAVAFDKQAYQAAGGYLGPTYAEDYDLWIRLLRMGRLASTNETTLDYFVSERSLSRIKRTNALNVRFGLQRRAIRAFAKRHPAAAACVLPMVILRQALNAGTTT